MTNLSNFGLPLVAAIVAAAKSLNRDANADYAVALGGDGECDEWERCKITARFVDNAEAILIDLEDAEWERRTLLRAQEAYAEAIERPAKVACVGLSQTLETRIRQLEAAE